MTECSSRFKKDRGYGPVSVKLYFGIVVREVGSTVWF